VLTGTTTIIRVVAARTVGAATSLSVAVAPAWADTTAHIHTHNFSAALAHEAGAW
jgi:hypothetical protein